MERTALVQSKSDSSDIAILTLPFVNQHSWAEYAAAAPQAAHSAVSETFTVTKGGNKKNSGTSCGSTAGYDELEVITKRLVG